MLTTKETANFFWHGNPPSLYEINCLLSFVKNDFNVNLWTFTKFDVPTGINICDAREFFNQDDILKFKQDEKVGCLAAFSDAFRYHVLNKYQGWWFDTDCVCLTDQSNFKKLKENRKIVAGYEDDTHINGAVLSFNDAKLSIQSLQMLNATLDECSYNIKWGGIGPQLITKLVNTNDLRDSILPPSFFYPVSYKHALDALDPNKLEDIETMCSQSYVYHCWNEVLTRKQVNKNIMPTHNSFLFKKFSNQ